MIEAVRTRCNSVTYRQGFIEVASDIHEGLINVEAWNIEPETDLSASTPEGDEIPEEAVMSNTELELTPAEARRVAAALVAAASFADRTQQEALE